MNRGKKNVPRIDFSLLFRYPGSEVVKLRIIPYDDMYRDDMIFMVLEAKDALGRVPGLNEDLLDVRKNYLDKGDMFWLALSDAGRVVGCIGYSAIPDTDDVWLHRFYVKAALKRQGGSPSARHWKTARPRPFGREGLRGVPALLSAFGIRI